MKTYAPILFILAASIAFSRVLTLMQVPQTISTWILDSFAGNKVLILIVVNIFLLFVGMVMDTTPAILILTPILLPIMNGVGVDSIHFGVMMVVNLAIGFVTPPIGVNLFVASSLTDIPVVQIAKRALPIDRLFPDRTDPDHIYTPDQPCAALEKEDKEDEEDMECSDGCPPYGCSARAS